MGSIVPTQSGVGGRGSVLTPVHGGNTFTHTNTVTVSALIPTRNAVKQSQLEQVQSILLLQLFILPVCTNTLNSSVTDRDESEGFKQPLSMKPLS